MVMDQKKRVVVGGRSLVEITEIVAESCVGYGAKLSCGSGSAVFTSRNNGTRNVSQSSFKITSQPNRKH